MAKQLQIPNKQLLIAAGVGVASAAVISAAVLYYKIKKEQIPKKWKRVGELTELICYPIKSCGPIRLDKVNCSDLGIANGYLRDRTFMITTLDGDMVTARAYPQLVKINPQIEKDVLTLSANGMMDISLNITEIKTKPSTKHTVWFDTVDSIDCGEEIAKWISRFILQEDTGLRLVYFPSTVPTRGAEKVKNQFLNLLKDDTGALHDLSSYMIMNEGSVAELNSRLDEPVTALRFRPNFVVKGPTAFAEDDWKWVRIGNDVVFRHVQPCTRCVLTTVDPETGTKSPDDEPLKTLRTYRKVPEFGESPVFGVHIGTRSNGVINLGDAIYIPA